MRGLNVCQSATVCHIIAWRVYVSVYVWYGNTDWRLFSRVFCVSSTSPILVISWCERIANESLKSLLALPNQTRTKQFGRSKNSTKSVKNEKNVWPTSCKGGGGPCGIAIQSVSGAGEIGRANGATKIATALESSSRCVDHMWQQCLVSTVRWFIHCFPRWPLRLQGPVAFQKRRHTRQRVWYVIS